MEILFADVDDVKFVINFDFSSGIEDYVHRIGRTGRSNKTGTAYTFFTRENSKHAKELVGILTEANQVVNPQLMQMSMTSGFGGKLHIFINLSFLFSYWIILG